MKFFDSVDIPVKESKAKGNAAWRKKYRETNKEKIAAAKWLYDEKVYLSRPFIAWDGEGVTNPKDNSHHYIMLANSEHADIGIKNTGKKYSGLSTLDIFAFICEQGKENPGAIHIIFGGGYDFNMFCKDIPKEDMWKIYTQEYWEWEDYRISWRRGKYFSVRDMADRDSKTVMIYDVWPFFQGSFIHACDEFLGDQFIGRDEIIINKADRGNFKNEDYDTIRHYNDLELINLVHLADELRSRLNAIGLRMKRWDGPGTIASMLLSKNKIKDAMAETPKPVALAARFAYSGGRFEQILFGHVNDVCYEYDINSAYPWALTKLPNLQRGTWHHYNKKELENKKITRFEFAMYRVDFFEDISKQSVSAMTQPRPLFKRDKYGNICYPEVCSGWYWASEAYNALEYKKRYPHAQVTIKEAWVFKEWNKNDRPFKFVQELYDERRKMKAEHNGAQIGIKLGLNSMYGKLAQQVGWRKDYDGTIHTPPFHQLEWAGYTTALCRATVFLAAIDELECVIAYETDALFTTKKLDLPCSDLLGEWEYTEFNSLTYIQSGFYFANDEQTETGEPISKSRGINKGIITRDMVLDAIENRGIIKAEVTRFISVGQALYQDWNKWCTWITSPREIKPGETTSKRFHAPDRCMVCFMEHLKDNEKDVKLGVWHPTLIRNLDYKPNTEYHIEWMEQQLPEKLKKSFKKNRDELFRQETPLF